MKTSKIIYWVSTGLLTTLMLFSAGMYIFNHAEISTTFETLGHPTYIIYPLAVLKLFGLVAIWTRKSATLTEWAYSGFFFNFVLATAAHLSVGDGEFGGAAFAIVLVLTSYFTLKQVQKAQT